LPVRSMRPEDDQPLARPVHEQRLARPASEEQAEATQEAEGEQGEPRQADEEQTSPQAEGASQGDKGPIARTMDRAQENNWVYDSVATKARETGLVDKADEILDKARSRLSGG